MACVFGNCNDANCVNGDTTDVNGNPCDDASCSPCGSIAVTGGVPASTVAPNPSISSAASNPGQLTQMTATLGQWGATIASIVSGTPSVIGPQGSRTGVASLTPNQIVGGNQGTMIMIILLVGVVIVVLAIGKR